MFRVPPVRSALAAIVLMAAVAGCNGASDPATPSLDPAPADAIETPVPRAAPLDGGFRTDDPGADCVGCHAEIVEAYASNSKGIAGIACDACHGDPTDHILTMDPVDIDSPVHLELDAQEAACAACHVPPGEPEWARSLQASACFRASGSMTCLTCHDPHRTDPTGAGVTFPSAGDACSACHDPGACAKPAAERGRDTCAQCHMPRRPTWTDHTISRRSRDGR